MTRRHRHVGAYALVVDEDQVLLILKAKGPYTGSWDLPGGGIEHGEAPEEAVARELREETGLALRSAELLAAMSYRVTYTLPSGEPEDLHHLGMVYRAVVDRSGALLEGPDGIDSLGARWVPAAGELPGLALSPFARRALIQGGLLHANSH